MTEHPTISNAYARITAKDSSIEAIMQSYKDAFELHDKTCEAVQVAYADGFVHSFISEDGRTFGNLATIG